MAETSALAAYKAGQKESKGKRSSNVFYLPIGRTLTTIGGVLRMVNARNVQNGVQYLLDGNLTEARRYLGVMFDGGDVKDGAKIIATGIVLGKALDHTKTNPRIKMGKYGIKLV